MTIRQNDNLKTVVDRWENDQPICNRRFPEFATHSAFRPIACRPRRPQTKGKVERPFDYVQESLLSGREFRTLEHLNVIARHALCLQSVRGEQRVNEGHRAPRETRPRRDVLQARFADFGDIGTRFFEGLWQARRHAPSQACLILKLSGAYMRSDFIAALERAVRFGAYGLPNVRRIPQLITLSKSSLDSLVDFQPQRCRGDNLRGMCVLCSRACAAKQSQSRVRFSRSLNRPNSESRLTSTLALTRRVQEKWV